MLEAGAYPALRSLSPTATATGNRDPSKNIIAGVSRKSEIFCTTECSHFLIINFWIFFQPKNYGQGIEIN